MSRKAKPDSVGVCTNCDGVLPMVDTAHLFFVRRVMGARAPWSCDDGTPGPVPLCAACAKAWWLPEALESLQLPRSCVRVVANLIHSSDEVIRCLIHESQHQETLHSDVSEARKRLREMESRAAALPPSDERAERGGD